MVELAYLLSSMLLIIVNAIRIHYYKKELANASALYENLLNQRKILINVCRKRYEKIKNLQNQLASKP